MKFRLLGPLEFYDGTGWARLSAAKLRALLATLLLNPNRVVATDQLIEQLWPEPTTKAPANLLHQYVLRLRRLLNDPRGGLLVTHAPGYQLRLASLDDIDASRFGRLLADGQTALQGGDGDRATDLFGAALGLWRGAAFFDVPSNPLITAEAAGWRSSA